MPALFLLNPPLVFYFFLRARILSAIVDIFNMLRLFVLKENNNYN